MKRYVVKMNDNKFAKWIQWTAGVVPLIREDVFDKAFIISDEYLSYVIEGVQQTRKELIHEHYPTAEIIPVKVTLEV
ncbi:hypothetical protein NSQ93_22485 [Bacillus sp. FSL W8-0445]|uniref:hypothetical protein n=1 Tax=Bacillota TaxID=1239 RepID=UPI000928A97E|nr:MULTISPECIES: hypothetical protein [Bacillota]MDE1407022.1 hypothetical protein [Bacillus licheniformis]NFT30589.1 hypothetical protein [Clostridium sporogenes]OJT57338.1 hypothetical protein BFP47_11555 [Bacillus licheniformis]OJT70020.1 hypothetical protein BFP46_05335 [Bacillus licheniformis]TWM14743.1 hypothetical protein CHCC15091_1784 [Bacillus licheniformis]